MTVHYSTSYYIVLLHSINSILTLRSVAFCPVAFCLSGLLSCGLLSVVFCLVAFCPVAFCRGAEGDKYRWGIKISDFLAVSRYISQSTQDSDIVTMEGE